MAACQTGPGALEVEGLSVSYGKFVAVESVTLSVTAGECVAVIGPNGHGKSSMVTAVAGLVRRGGDGAGVRQSAPAGGPGRRRPGLASGAGTRGTSTRN